jgi:hypothetical protein
MELATSTIVWVAVIVVVVLFLGWVAVGRRIRRDVDKFE